MNRTKNNLWGLFWKLVSCFAFAAINTLVRYLTGGAGACAQPLPSEVIVLFQNIFGFLIFLPFLVKNNKRQNNSPLKPRWVFLHALRIFMAVMGIISLYYAFAHMPMAQAVALQFTGPVFAVIGARLYLKESMNFSRIVGVFLGLGGAFIITRPDRAFLQADMSYSWYFILPLLSALAFAVVKILNRELSLRGESAQLLTSYLLFFMIPASALPAFAKWVLPDLISLLLLLALGILACLAHYSMAKALAFADVTFLTPFGFARIIFTAFLGFIFYAELPTNNNLWVGFSLIMLSTIFISFGEREKANKLALIA